MRLYEDFFDDVDASDEMVKSSDVQKQGYEYIMVLEQEVFIPENKFSEAPDWKVWDILFIRFIKLIDDTKFIEDSDVEVRFNIPQFIRFLIISKMSGPSIEDEILTLKDYYVTKKRFAENKNIIHDILKRMTYQFDKSKIVGDNGVWMTVLHRVKFNVNKFPLSGFDKMKSQYLRIYEYSKLFNDSLITNTHTGNMHRNGELKILDAANPDKKLYSEKMWSHYMNNRSIIEFFKAINGGDEEWDDLDIQKMASQKQYDGDECLGTIVGKYDSYSVFKPFVRNILNNDFLDFKDVAADITRDGEYIKLFLRVDNVKNVKKYTAPKIFEFIEDCLFNCTEIQRAAISRSEISDIKIYIMCDNSNMPQTKKQPKSKAFADLYMNTEYYGIFGHTINITTFIVDENYQLYGDSSHTDPMNSLCRRFQTDITTIKKNKNFTNYLLS